MRSIPSQAVIAQKGRGNAGKLGRAATATPTRNREFSQPLNRADMLPVVDDAPTRMSLRRLIEYCRVADKAFQHGQMMPHVGSRPSPRIWTGYLLCVRSAGAPLPVQSYRGSHRVIMPPQGREAAVHGRPRQSPLGFIEDHHLGHKGLDATLVRQTASPPDRREILLNIAHIVRLVEILRKKLKETVVVWLVATLE
jgi:hypothetical protein